MGAADFNTGAKISGTKEEVFAILNVLHSYVTEKRKQYREKRNCPYLMSVCIEGENEFGTHKPLCDFSDEELMTFIEEKKCTVCVNASGPYGVFNGLEDINLFHEMAEVAPNAIIVGGMGGFDPGADQAASFELKDGLLHCKYAVSYFGDELDEDYDEDDEDGEDDEDDWNEEEPEWGEEVVYDPVKKKYVK